MLQWSNPAQLKRYQDYQKSNGIPVFVVIGLGGIPDDPEEMFCIPLTEAKYPDLFMSLLNNYKRNPEKPFQWNNNQKRLI